MDPCIQMTCSLGERCAAGTCIEDECLGVACPSGEQCEMRLGIAQCVFVEPSQTNEPVEAITFVPKERKSDDALTDPDTPVWRLNSTRRCRLPRKKTKKTHNRRLCRKAVIVM